MIIALYDTNVLISGTFWRGVPRLLIRLARKKQIQVVTGQALLDELQSVLTRPDKPFRLSQAEASLIADDVLTYASSVVPTREVTICRDPDDNSVLACALAGRAEYLVTGDPDLLVLEKYEGVAIVKVRDFVQIFLGEHYQRYRRGEVSFGRLAEELGMTTWGLSHLFEEFGWPASNLPIVH
jgi:putative PIN family toxin of toxin-antitoxin system